MDYTLLNRLPVWCKKMGVDDAIICSGSRSAPLTLSFSGYKAIKCTAATDERSAGFIALGIAKASNKPVVIITTSGTAVANLFPAVAEAFYQNITLMVFSADREEGAASRFDGQAIEQYHIFGKHTIGSFQMPLNMGDENLFASNLEPIQQLLSEKKQGPIHVNFPFKEPFYPSIYPFIYPDIEIGAAIYAPPVVQKIQALKDIWNQTPKKIFIAGFDGFKHASNRQVEAFTLKHNIPLITDITSNIGGGLLHHDVLIRNIKNKTEFEPELVITIGGNHTSKVLKKYIQESGHKHHWHIRSFDVVSDFFRAPTARISFDDLLQIADDSLSSNHYLETWKKHEEKGKETFSKYINDIAFHEISATKNIIAHTPKDTIIHLANSMAVRWANIIGDSTHQIFCNRGTSGIDGCTSTAVGMAIAQPEKKHILITGDMAFQYDNNAFFHSHIPENLKIIIFNNQGGRIFDLIDGPTMEMPIKNYFVNQHGLSFERLAAHYGLGYAKIENMESLKSYIADQKTSCSVAEVIFDVNQYKPIFEQYKNLSF